MSLDIHKTYMALSIVLADHAEKLAKSREICTFLLREMMCEYKTESWGATLYIVFKHTIKCIGINKNTFETMKVSATITWRAEKISDNNNISYKDFGKMRISFEYHHTFAYITIFNKKKKSNKSYLSLADANSLIMEIDNYLSNQQENQPE